uniref:Uncharacterized protein n=1 Tax=Strigamia maritima TaxID=126957 RepID=T1IV95_STRMM
MSCPRGYESSMLFTGKQEVLKTYSKCEQECTGWLFWKKCNDICHPVENPKIYNYQTYWCGAKGDVDKETGYMFGGIYDTVANDLQHCPDHFYNLKLTDRIMVCVSNDYSVGFKNSISFGGFFSCSSNNPIADGQRGCPTGYEQILVGLMDECEVKYCIRRQTQETSELIQDIQLVRPPYKTLVQNFMSSDPNKCYKEEEVPTSTLVSVSQSQSISVLMQSLLIAFGVAIFILFVLLCCVWRRNIKSALMTTYSGAVDYVLIPTSNGCKASKDFLATNVAEPTGTFLSTKIFSPTAIVSKTAYNSSKDFMSRAWASTRHNTNGYVLVPVVEGLRKSIEFTKNHVGEPMKLSWVKMKSRCMGAPNLSSQRENLQFLSPDCNAVLVDVAPQSVNPFSSTDNQRLIDNDSYAMCYGDKMNEKAEGPTNDPSQRRPLLLFTIKDVIFNSVTSGMYTVFLIVHEINMKSVILYHINMLAGLQYTYTDTLFAPNYVQCCRPLEISSADPFVNEQSNTDCASVNDFSIEIRIEQHFK